MCSDFFIFETFPSPFRSKPLKIASKIVQDGLGLNGDEMVRKRVKNERITVVNSFVNIRIEIYLRLILLG